MVNIYIYLSKYRQIKKNIYRQEIVWLYILFILVNYSQTK